MATREERLEDAARQYERAAGELRTAAAHCETSARHLRDAEIPRAAAHAWAARGLLLHAERDLDDQARTHASRSNV